MSKRKNDEAPRYVVREWDALQAAALNYAKAYHADHPLDVLTISVRDQCRQELDRAATAWGLTMGTCWGCGRAGCPGAICGGGDK